MRAWARRLALLAVVGAGAATLTNSSAVAQIPSPPTLPPGFTLPTFPPPPTMPVITQPTIPPPPTMPVVTKPTFPPPPTMPVITQPTIPPPPTMPVVTQPTIPPPTMAPPRVPSDVDAQIDDLIARLDTFGSEFQGIIDSLRQFRRI